jgi:hypothetical protein
MPLGPRYQLLAASRGQDWLQRFLVNRQGEVSVCRVTHSQMHWTKGFHNDFQSVFCYPILRKQD